MQNSPQRHRTLAAALVAIGFIAELVGVGLLGADRTPPALIVMGLGLLLVIVAMIVLNSGPP